MSFSVAAVIDGRAALAREILEELPEWFGIPEATENYIRLADELPMIGCFAEGQARGFLSLRQQTPHALEIVVMGVRPAWHRQGTGRALITAAETETRRRRCGYLIVRTLAASDPDPSYAATRAFYTALGFVDIEVLPDLWGPGLSSALFVKSLRQ